MKTICILSAFALVGTCATPKYTAKIQTLKDNIRLTDSAIVAKYANTITVDELKDHLYTFSSNAFEGRKTGEFGQKKAAAFLQDYYLEEGIASPFNNKNYFQKIPDNALSKDIKASENVMAFVKGSKMPDEIIIISAHLDHLGISKDGEVYNGADDDGSGNVALMEMAQAFQNAKDQGYGPKRSILFLHLTGEELGMRGSEYYTKNPVFPLKNTIANLNIDMIGRIDKIHETNNNPNYIYLIGSNRLSKELHYVSEKVNNKYFKMDLDYRYNAEDDSNNYYSRSDHYNFALHNIPVIFYFNGEHKDYHQVTDTADKIEYKLLAERTKLIFTTAWQIANQEHRLVIDEHNELLK